MNIDENRINEIKDYIGAYDETDERIEELIITAESYIDLMVGDSYKTNPKKVKLSLLLIKKLAADMYDNRSTTVDKKFTQDPIVTSILDSLSVEEEDNV